MSRNTLKCDCCQNKNVKRSDSSQKDALEYNKCQKHSKIWQLSRSTLKCDCCQNKKCQLSIKSAVECNKCKKKHYNVTAIKTTVKNVTAVKITAKNVADVKKRFKILPLPRNIL